MREPRPDWSPLEVNFKILDGHPHLFYIRIPPTLGIHLWSRAVFPEEKFHCISFMILHAILYTIYPRYVPPPILPATHETHIQLTFFLGRCVTSCGNKTPLYDIKGSLVQPTHKKLLILRSLFILFYNKNE